MALAQAPAANAAAAGTTNERSDAENVPDAEKISRTAGWLERMRASLKEVIGKLEEARKHGAHHGVIAGDRLGDDLRKIAKYGFDAVIDCTGVGAVTKTAIPFVKNGGKLLIFGVCGPQEMVEISPFEIYRRDLEIIGSFAIRRSYDRAHRLMEAGVFDVKALVSEVMPLNELTRALHLMKAGTAGMKLQIQLGG